ncbi:MAG: epoxyqueuosine reductase QueH, partial [Sphingobacteriaceae bacterium]
MNNYIRNSLNTSYNERKVLLHSCCAPCSGGVIEAMINSGLDITIFFYNPNIHPKKEYLLRKNENIKYAEKLNIPFIDADYDVQEWFKRAKGMDHEPERGIRCTMCFDMRFERTALYAYENDFSIFTSCLGISMWKDIDQINRSGELAASHYEGLTYWTYNWKLDNGSTRMYEIATDENFYKQEYCGCIFSLKNTNDWRIANGNDQIVIGQKYYAT